MVTTSLSYWGEELAGVAPRSRAPLYVSTTDPAVPTPLLFLQRTSSTASYQDLIRPFSVSMSRVSNWIVTDGKYNTCLCDEKYNDCKSRYSPYNIQRPRFGF
jgi:hypothetical protein